MKRFYRMLTALVVLMGAVALPFSNVNAQSSNSLTINPRKNYTLKPGESVTDTLSVTNPDNNRALILDLSIVDFSAKDESGTPALEEDDSTTPTAWSLRSYIDLPEQVTIGAGKTVNVPMVIKMPKDIGAGSYYSAIKYAASTSQGQNVTIAASSVTLVFVTVPGQAKEQLDFKQFGAWVPTPGTTTGTFAGLFFSKPPMELAYRLSNQGNIAEQPKGSIVVRDFFGKQVAVIGDANPKQQLALRGQTRLFDTCIKGEKQKTEASGGTQIETITCVDPGLKPGRYAAEMSILYGANGNETREITAKAYFWYLPWWFIGIMVAILLVIAAVVFFVFRRVQDIRNRKTRRR